jgi:tetraacyldisaccharide 4'-kinase
MELLRKIAFPISLLYAAVVYVRNRFFDLGIFPTRRFETPTICIGNLSVGGTGKTPMIEWILEQLSAHRSLAVLSRGYKRKTKGFVLVQSEHTAEEVGDEPLQIARKFPDCTVAVDANRQRGIARIEEEIGPQLILLDDAFQHRKVTARMNILLTTYQNPYTEDCYLPSGQLRDSKKEARRAHFILVTKCPLDISEITRAQIISRIDPLPHQEVLFCRLAYDLQLRGTSEPIALQTLRGQKVMVVTGIANPKPLLQFLASQGVITMHKQFPDHHFFTAKELAQFNAEPMIITTEKDFARMGKAVPKACYLPVKHLFLGDGKERILKALKAL